MSLQYRYNIRMSTGKLRKGFLKDSTEKRYTKKCLKTTVFHFYKKQKIIFCKSRRKKCKQQ